MFAWRAFPSEPGASPGAYLTVPGLSRRGIEVAFTTRHGGSSGEPYASLNLSYVSGDDRDTVRANRGRALSAVGGRVESWTGARQVHGARVARVGAHERGAGWDSPNSVIPETDALWTDEPDISIVVLTADCVPVVLADTARLRVGVVHVGWRGLLGGVLAAAVDSMGGADGLSAYVGPSIGPCCYEVGPEISERAGHMLGDVLRGDGERKRLDLWAASLVALARAGVREVWPAALCTRSEQNRFFSNRAGSAARQGVLARLAS